MKSRTFQYLRMKAGYGTKGSSTRIKVWPCKYIGCNRILNDVDNQLDTKWCKFHKRIIEKEKNHRCFVKRVGLAKDFQKNQLLLSLLKNHASVSKYQILAFTQIKNMDSLRSQITFLRRRGHKITRRIEMYSLEKE